MASKVSRIYGDAYVNLKLEEKQLEKAMEETKTVREVLHSNEELKRFLHHPQITKEEKMKTIETIWKGNVSDDMVGFLRIIIRKGRSREMDGILDYIIERIRKLLGIGCLEVTSAIPLSEEQKKKIREKVLGGSDYQDLEISYKTDVSIIGGLILRMDNRIVDSSIRTKLTSMGDYLSGISR